VVQIQTVVFRKFLITLRFLRIEGQGVMMIEDLGVDGNMILEWL
jgi:hypothetical protein